MRTFLFLSYKDPRHCYICGNGSDCKPHYCLNKLLKRLHNHTRDKPFGKTLLRKWSKLSSQDKVARGTNVCAPLCTKCKILAGKLMASLAGVVTGERAKRINHYARVTTSFMRGNQENGLATDDVGSVMRQLIKEKCKNILYNYLQKSGIIVLSNLPTTCLFYFQWI